MKVSILTEGGRDIGFGHFNRCFSLYDEFVRSGADAHFIVNEDKALLDKLSGDGISHAVYRDNQDCERISGLLNDADILVIDSYLFGREAYIRFCGQVRLLVSLDDYNRMEYPDGIVVNGSIGADNLNYARNGKTVFLLGPQYFPLRRGFSRPNIRKVRDKIGKILITFGGSDTGNMTPKVVSFILEKFEGVDLNVLIGPGFKNRDYIETFRQDKRVHFSFGLSVKETCSLMLASDIAISAGGQTIYELVFTGTPAIGICVADNQLANLEGWQKLGVLEFIGRHNEVSLFNRLEAALDKLSDRAARTVLGNNGMAHIDGKGSRRIVRVARESLNLKFA